MEQVNAFQMPVCIELATKLGPKLFRKTVLKTGTINYMGQQINFDTDMLNQYVTNFNAGAKDQVPFVLVDASNRHVDLPERYRGEIKGLEVSEDGTRLEAVLEMTGAGAKLIDDNPNLGVSIRAVDRLERPDGLTFGPTIEHVAGTLDPKINGLGPWIPVELSNPTANVIDLSGTDEESESAKSDKEREPMASLTDEQMAKLLRLIEGSDEAPDKNKKNKVDHSESDDDDDEQRPETDANDTELESVADAAEDEDENEDEPLLVNASNVDREALELANARIDAQAVELARLRTEADRTRYESERQELWSKFNLPPRIVDLARPLLEGSSNVVELSNGKKVDAGQTIRKVLHEFGTLMARLDLSNELGSSQENDENSEAERVRARDEFLKVAGAQLRGNTGGAARNGGN